MKQKEVTKYIQDKEKLLSLIKTYCEFMKISENKEMIEYTIPDNMTVFNILNIPLKMNKEDVKKNIELINLQYNRLYKRGFYWVLSTIDKETVICMQNSLRDLTFEDSKVKYDLSNRNQIYRAMKEQVEKSSYQKEAKNLGISGNSGNKNNFNKKGSDADSDAFSWRKGSCEGKTSFDVNEKNYKKNNNNYYNNRNNNQRKRNRFNSDNQGSPYNNYYDNNNYYNNNNNYYNNNNYKNNHYNNNHRNNNNNNKDIEIDISNLKYPIHIKYKYSFTDIKTFYKNICDNNLFPEKPKYLSDIFNEIISDKKKDVVVLDELIESSKQLEQLNNNNEIKEKNDKINTNLKIPKMNPLSNMGKGFGIEKPMNTDNHPSTVEENTKEE